MFRLSCAVSLEAARIQLESLRKAPASAALEMEDVHAPAPPVMPWGSKISSEEAETIPATEEELNQARVSRAPEQNSPPTTPKAKTAAAGTFLFGRTVRNRTRRI